jgi:hypothetical protein
MVSGTFALRDVGIDQNEAAARHRITARLDDAAIGSRPFETQFLVGVLEAPAQFGFEVGRVLAALGEIAEILDMARPLGEESIGQVEDCLEIAVPGNKARVSAEHDNAVAHIVEGDAQLGLTVAQFLEQPGILDRDHRLVSKGGGQLDLLARVGLDARPVNSEYADQLITARQRNAEHRAVASDFL